MRGAAPSHPPPLLFTFLLDAVLLTTIVEELWNFFSLSFLAWFFGFLLLSLMCLVRITSALCLTTQLRSVRVLLQVAINACRRLRRISTLFAPVIQVGNAVGLNVARSAKVGQIRI